MEKLITYLNNLWTATITPAVKSSWDKNKRNTDNIIQAIKERKNATDISVNNLDEISSPVVEAVSNVQKAVEGIKLPELPETPEQIDTRGQLEAIQKTLKRLLKKENKIIVKNDLNKALALFKSDKDKKELVKAINGIAIPEAKDYTKLLVQLVEKETNNKNIEDLLGELINTGSKTKDLVAISKYLQKLLEVEQFDLSRYLDKEGRLPVQVDKVGGGGGGGLTSEESAAVIGGATEDKQDTLIDNQTSGAQLTQISDVHGNPVSAQHPLPTNGDSTYDKDVDEDLSDVGTFTGTVGNLFNDYKGNIALEDTSATSLKWFKIKIVRPLTASSVTLGTSGYTFSNVKIILLSGGGEVVGTIDDSTSNIPHINQTYQFPPVKFTVVKVEFHTANPIHIAGCSIDKEVSVVSRIQGIDDSTGLLTNAKFDNGEFIIGGKVGLKDSNNNNINPATEDKQDDIINNKTNGLLVAQGLISGHSIVNKFGQNDNLNSATYEDIWENGGVYQYPADNTAPITKLVAHDVNDTEPIEVQGLDIDGNLVVQTKTLTGTTAVTLDTPLWRIFRLKNTGTSDLIADVCAIDDADTQDYACISAGNNQTLMALYTIPAGKTGYLMQGTNNLSGVTRAVAASGKLLMRPFGSVFQLKKTFGVNSEGSSFIKIESPLPSKIPEKTDIKVSAIGSANGVSLNTTFDILLIDN